MLWDLGKGLLRLLRRGDESREEMEIYSALRVRRFGIYNLYTGIILIDCCHSVLRDISAQLTYELTLDSNN